MNRREFMVLIGGALLTSSRIARAQQPTMPVVGFMNSQSPLPTGIWRPRLVEA
jgi:hypothetical protein